MEKGAIPMQQSYDVVIIGGGVVGSAIARELSRYKLRIAVLEKESDVCTQTSRRNTGMLLFFSSKRRHTRWRTRMQRSFSTNWPTGRMPMGRPC